MFKDQPAVFYYQVLTHIVSHGGTPIGPYLIPPSFPSDGANKPLDIYVRYVRGSASSAPCTIAGGGDNKNFSLDWDLSDGLPVAHVTVQATHVYSDKPDDRAALLGSFNAFRIALEKMELADSPQCLAPGGADVIARTVAASIPLRIDEVLAYQYGLAPGGNYVDLAPGMRLRIDAGGYDFVAPSSAWNGFGAAGGPTCTVARSSAQDVYFDAFLDAMATSVPLGTPAWIGGLADLASLGPRRHFRLVYPRTMSGPTQTSAAPAFGQTPALLGADTLTGLAAATAAYFKEGTCATATSGRPVVCAAFSGRTGVVPEVLVQFLGQWLYLPVGSTVQQLLDLYSPLFRSQFAAQSGGISAGLTRMGVAGLVSDQPSLGPVPVMFSNSTQYVARPEGRQLSQWDLPLLQGDAFSLQLGS